CERLEALAEADVAPDRRQYRRADPRERPLLRTQARLLCGTATAREGELASPLLELVLAALELGRALLQLVLAAGERGSGVRDVPCVERLFSLVEPAPACLEPCLGRLESCRLLGERPLALLQLLEPAGPLLERQLAFLQGLGLRVERRDLLRERRLRSGRDGG